MVFVPSELLTKKDKAKTRQGEPHRRPQVEHSPAKSLRAATTADNRCHLTASATTRPRSRPSISGLSPSFAFSSSGQEKEQCGSRWSSRGNRQSFPEDGDPSGPLQQELREEPEGVPSGTLGQIPSFPGSPFPPLVLSAQWFCRVKRPLSLLNS